MPPKAVPKRALPTDNSATAKKRKVGENVKNNRLAKLSQAAPPSSFEEELENLSQEITDLKDGGAERDQKWDRPAVDDAFDPQTDSLLFQQIDVEEGNLGGQNIIRLFGVTEVFLALFMLGEIGSVDNSSGRIFRSATRHGFHALHLRRCTHRFHTRKH